MMLIRQWSMLKSLKTEPLLLNGKRRAFLATKSSTLLEDLWALCRTEHLTAPPLPISGSSGSTAGVHAADDGVRGILARV